MATPSYSLPTVPEAYAACQTLVRERAKNFYFAFLPLPKPKRHAIYAVYAFSRACDDYSDESLPLDEKRRRLDGHRRQLHAAFEGRPSDSTFVALWDATQRYGIPREYFDSLIDGVVMDLSINRYDTFEDLRNYCYHVASVVGLICIEIFQYQETRAKEYAVDLGIGMQLVNIMRDVKEDAERDRIYLPQEDMRRFGYSEAALMANTLNRPFVELMRFQTKRAREHFQRAGGLLPLVAPRARPCPAVLRALYLKILCRIESNGYNVFDRPVSLSTGSKLLTVLQTWIGTAARGLLPSR